MKARQELARMQQAKREAKASLFQRLGKREWLNEKIAQNKHHLECERRRVQQAMEARQMFDWGGRRTGKSMLREWAKCLPAAALADNGTRYGPGPTYIWFDEAKSIPASALDSLNIDKPGSPD